MDAERLELLRQEMEALRPKVEMLRVLPIWEAGDVMCRMTQIMFELNQHAIEEQKRVRGS